jgi:hypothetical protein
MGLSAPGAGYKASVITMRRLSCFTMKMYASESSLEFTTYGVVKSRAV